MTFQYLIQSMISVDIIESFLWLYNPLMAGGNKRLLTFKQICRF